MRSAWLLLLLAACSPDVAIESEAESEPRASEAQVTDPAASVESSPPEIGPAPSGGVGRVEVVVRVAGPRPEPRYYSIGGTPYPSVTEPDLDRSRVPDPLWWVNPDGTLEEAVVAISGVPAELVPVHEPREIPVTIDLHRYIPCVISMSVGDTLQFTNPTREMLCANVKTRRNSFAHIRPGVPGDPDSWTPEKRELSVRLDACLFKWLSGTVSVFDHPWHDSVADEDGRFVIEDVPAGTWTLGVLHPFHSRKSTRQTITVTAGETLETTVTVPGWKPRKR